MSQDVTPITRGPFEVIKPAPAPEKPQVLTLPSREQWLKERQKGVGASEVSSLFGLDPYGKSIATLFDEKVGVIQEDVDSPDMQRGRALEPIILRLYMEATGRVVVPAGLRVHPDEPHMLATPDGMVVGDDVPVEVKCVRLNKFSRIKHQGLSDGWLMQVMAQLEVTQRPWASYAFFNADSWSLVTFDIERDLAIGAAILAKVREFWTSYIETGIRPSIPLVHDLPVMPSVPGQLMVRNDPEWAEAVGMLVEAKNLSVTAEEIEDAAKGRIKGLMGGYGAAEGAGLRAYFRELGGRVTFDKKALAAAKPLDRLSVAAYVNQLRGVRGYTSKAAKKVIDTVLAQLGTQDLDLVLSAFEKQSKPFEEFRSYFLKPEPDEQKMLPAPKLRLERGE